MLMITLVINDEKNSLNETLTDRNYPRKRTNSKKDSHHEGIDKTVLAIKLKNYGIAQQIVGQYRIDCRGLLPFLDNGKWTTISSNCWTTSCPVIKLN